MEGEGSWWLHTALEVKGSGFVLLHYPMAGLGFGLEFGSLPLLVLYRYIRLCSTRCTLSATEPCVGNLTDVKITGLLFDLSVHGRFHASSAFVSSSIMERNDLVLVRSLSRHERKGK